MVNHALKEGMTKEELAGLPIPIHALEDPEAVPAELFFDLHERLDEALGPGFAVRVGQHMEMDDYGVLGLSWKTCSKAAEIFERCERYFHLLSNTYVTRVEKVGPLSYIKLFRDPYRQGVGFSNEATFSATVVVLRAMTESDITPLEVSFKQGAPIDLRSHQEAFKCPVKFNQSDNYLSYKTIDLEQRTAKADQSINRFLLERVEEETKGIALSTLKIATDVESLIKDALPSGIPSIIQVSEAMGMSSRTLARRLAEGGLNFRELVKQTQENISKDLLKNSTHTVSEIAFQTRGFQNKVLLVVLSKDGRVIHLWGIVFLNKDTFWPKLS